MPRAFYNRNCSKEEVQDLLAKWEFEYFITLGSNVNLLANSEDFTWEQLTDRLNHIHLLEDEYDLERVRFFAADKQLEWKKRGSDYHVVIIHTDEQKSVEMNGFETEELEKDPNQPQATKIYLWGELDYDEYDAGNSVWYEENIPRLLDYPVHPSQIGNPEHGEEHRAYLEVQKYNVSSDDLETQLFHYQTIGSTKIG